MNTMDREDSLRAIKVTSVVPMATEVTSADGQRGVKIAMITSGLKSKFIRYNFYLMSIITCDRSQ